MATDSIILPNGIQTPSGAWTKEVVLDEITGEEEDILADRRIAPGGQGKFLRSNASRITEVLSRCTVSVGGETRPVGQDRFSNPNFFLETWKSAYSNDRVYAIIKLREISLGSMYEMQATCPNCHKELVNLKVDLNSFTVTNVPLEFAQKETHEVVLPKSGDVLEWRMLTGNDEDRVVDIVKVHEADLMTVLGALRLVAVNKERLQDHQKGTYLKRMVGADRNVYRKVYNEQEGGVDTTVEFTCDSCFHQFSHRLAVGHVSFFFL